MKHFLREIEDMRPTQMTQRWRWVCGCGAIGPVTLSDRASRIGFQQHRRQVRHPVNSDLRTLVHGVHW